MNALQEDFSFKYLHIYCCGVSRQRWKVTSVVYKPTEHRTHHQLMNWQLNQPLIKASFGNLPIYGKLWQVQTINNIVINWALSFRGFSFTLSDTALPLPSPVLHLSLLKLQCPLFHFSHTQNYRYNLLKKTSSARRHPKNLACSGIFHANRIIVCGCFCRMACINEQIE